jgi:hypothetical protein
MVSDDQLRDGFEAERPRLQRIAARILNDADAAQDVVQQAWLRLHTTDEPIDNLPGWLTTVTSRLCLDRLRARTPVPTESIEVEATAPDPADDVVVSADAAASALGTPTRLEGPDEVASFFNGAAAAAFPVFVEDRPGAAWIHRGEVKVAFDFTVEAGRVRRLQFRAADDVLAGVRRRTGGSVRE